MRKHPPVNTLKVETAVCLRICLSDQFQISAYIFMTEQTAASHSVLVLHSAPLEM